MSFIVSLLTTLVAILVFLLGTKIPSKRTSIAVRAIALLIASIAAIASILMQNYFLAFELKIETGAIAGLKSYG